MYHFDYCTKCFKLFNFDDIHCQQCNNTRFDTNNKMQNFFLQANLEDIQQYFFTGKFIIVYFYYKMKYVLIVCKVPSIKE
jgi:hypothetical protein